MSDLNSVKARLEEINAKRNVYIAEHGQVAPKPVCAACGGYAHTFSAALCRKHADELDNQVYCKYCLSNLTGISIENLKAEYDAIV